MVQDFIVWARRAAGRARGSVQAANFAPLPHRAAEIVAISMVGQQIHAILSEAVDRSEPFRGGPATRGAMAFTGALEVNF
jgi:hypothetical protein